jgi:hypothetical protein
MSDWIDNLNDGVFQMAMRLLRGTVQYWGNGAVAPTCAATVLGMLAVASYGEPRTQILNALTNETNIT